VNRRRLLQAAAAIPFLARLLARGLAPARAETALPRSRLRPGDAGWPSEASWDQLRSEVGGRLIKLESPFAACRQAPGGADCAKLFKRLKNPYFLGDDPALTQSLGWVDGWTSQPSAYAIAAETTADIVAAVNFARRQNLRLVVKGGGHAYQGTSNAPDSLLVWTRRMNAVTLHDGFVGAGCEGRAAPQEAVTVEAGAIWRQAYDAVTTKAGRYVQGGGCLTVGVAGLVQSGGFGSFSKRYGMAAASLLEAEIVTADGTVRTVNTCSDPDLFWAIKGGGGGSFGAVTRLTLRTHDLPKTFGAVFATVKAASDSAFRRLIGEMLQFYRDTLFNPHWGEQIRFRPDNQMMLSMLFEGLSQAEAEAIWRPFFDRLRAAPEHFTLQPPTILAFPARNFWDPDFLKQMPGIALTDDRPDAPPANIFWAGNLGEAGQVVHGYESAWIPGRLLADAEQPRLGDALFAASRHWGVSLHLNKGLAGAPAEAVAAARDTATNPAMLDAFALLISGAEGEPAYPGIAGHEPDREAAHRHAGAIAEAMRPIRALVGQPGAYLAESNFFEPDWQASFWGANYARLLAVKDRYDPDGLFVVHHGVGSERWSADGFIRLG
jgi:FAD/FMN-containing dehydrogenase